MDLWLQWNCLVNRGAMIIRGMANGSWHCLSSWWVETWLHGFPRLSSFFGQAGYHQGKLDNPSGMMSSFCRLQNASIFRPWEWFIFFQNKKYKVKRMQGKWNHWASHVNPVQRSFGFSQSASQAFVHHTSSAINMIIYRLVVNTHIAHHTFSPKVVFFFFPLSRLANAKNDSCWWLTMMVCNDWFTVS